MTAGAEIISGTAGRKRERLSEARKGEDGLQSCVDGAHPNQSEVF